MKAKSRLAYNRNKILVGGSYEPKYFRYQITLAFIIPICISLGLWCLKLSNDLGSLKSPVISIEFAETVIVHRDQTGNDGVLSEVGESGIEDYIKEVFGEEEGERGIKMLKECENKSMNETAINHNSNGSTDMGLWQVNSIHGHSQEELFDPKYNTRVAYEIYKRAGNSFSPWTCSYVVNERSYWQ